MALLLADFFIALRAKKEGVFVALALLTGSLCFLPVYLSLRFTHNDTAVFGILLIALDALFYLFLLLILKRKEKDRLRREKKHSREQTGEVHAFPTGKIRLSEIG